MNQQIISSAASAPATRRFPNRLGDQALETPRGEEARDIANFENKRVAKFCQTTCHRNGTVRVATVPRRER